MKSSKKAVKLILFNFILLTYFFDISFVKLCVFICVNKDFIYLSYNNIKSRLFPDEHPETTYGIRMSIASDRTDSPSNRHSEIVSSVHTIVPDTDLAGKVVVC